MKEKDLKILIGLPSMHNIDSKVRFEHDKIVNDTNGEFEITIEGYENFDRDDARNRMAQKALSEKFDYLFMVDDDMILPKNCLVNLYEAVASEFKINPMVTGGLYCNWGQSHHQHCYDYIQKEKAFKPNPVNPNTGLHARDMIGAGCCLIDVNVFNSIQFPYFKLDYIGNKRIGEDNYFFMNCFENSIPVYINSDVVCTHIGKFGVRPNKINMVEIVNLAKETCG